MLAIKEAGSRNEGCIKELWNGGEYDCKFLGKALKRRTKRRESGFSHTGKVTWTKKLIWEFKEFSVHDVRRGLVKRIVKGWGGAWGIYIDGVEGVPFLFQF